MQLMPALLAWWEADGSATPVIVDDTQNDWNAFVSYFATGAMDPTVTDPDGGNVAGKITESGSNQSQYVYKTTPAGLTNGPMFRECWQKADTGNYGGLGDQEALGGFGGFDLANGSVIVAPTLGTAWVKESRGLWRKNRIYMKEWVNVDYNICGCSNAAGAWSYPGTGKSIHVYGLRTYQLRCSVLGDQSGHGYHLSQSTPNNQFFLQTADGTAPCATNIWARRGCVWIPGDRLLVMTNDSAGLMSVLTQPYTMVERYQRLGAMTGANALFSTAGGTTPVTFGVDALNRPYIIYGSGPVYGPALDTTPHTLGFAVNPATGATTMWVDGVPTNNTLVGGALGPTSINCRARANGERARGFSGVYMSDAQMMAVHQAFVAQEAT
jgi:hypothetical protein